MSAPHDPQFARRVADYGVNMNSPKESQPS